MTRKNLFGGYFPDGAGKSSARSVKLSSLESKEEKALSEKESLKNKKTVKYQKKFDNKLFIVITIIVFVLLITGVISGGSEMIKKSDNTKENQNTTEISTKQKTNNFCGIDIIILTVGAGICTVKMIREKKNKKEKSKH